MQVQAGWIKRHALVVFLALLVAGILLSGGRDVRPVSAQTPNFCPAGFVLTLNGCVASSGVFGCPAGTVLTNAGCVPGNGFGACVNGFILTVNGCVQAGGFNACLTGFVLTIGGCMPAGGQVCAFGQVSTTSGCMPAGAAGCPFGTVQTVGGCVPNSSTCQPGFVLTTGGCMPSNSATSCGAGLVMTPSGCVPPSTQNLPPGCDEVVPTFVTVATPIGTIISGVQPSGIVLSAWQYSNSLHIWQSLYFATPGAPIDSSLVAAYQSVFLCLSAGGSFAG